MSKKELRRLAWEDMPIDTLVEVEVSPGVWALRYMHYCDSYYVYVFPDGRSSMTADESESEVAFEKVKFVEAKVVGVIDTRTLEEIREQGFKPEILYEGNEPSGKKFYVVTKVTARKSFTRKFKFKKDFLDIPAESS